MASHDPATNKLLQSRLDQPEKLTNTSDTVCRNTNVSTLSEDCLMSTLLEDCPNKARSTISEDIDCPHAIMSTISADCDPGEGFDNCVSTGEGSDFTVTREYPPTPASILDIPEGTHISPVSGGSGEVPEPTISRISSTRVRAPSLENPTFHENLLSISGCSKKVYNLMSKSKSQDKLDFNARKMPKDAVNGIVQMASIMAATLDTTKSHSKSSVSSLESTSVEQDEKHSQADLLGDGIDSQTLWETFKILAEKSLRNFSEKKPSRWKTVRHMVQWTPFIQTYKKKRYPWVQLAGHSGNFKAGKTQGTVLKKLCPAEETCYRAIMRDNTIKDLVPQYHGSITLDGDEQFIELQDCLSTFTTPCIMDCKVGVRTYLEEELTKARQKPTLRKDMYDKMMSVDPFAPTDEEHRQQGVTKPRYMVWRETISSTATLGFRIEGIKKGGVDFPTKDFKTTKTKEQLVESFRTFLTGYPAAAAQYIQRLQVIKKSLEKSPFFNSQEVIGSSLLFVHDQTKSNIWMIDFGKTAPVPSGITVDHRSPWQVGNHEDGYLGGIENIINIFQQIHQTQG